MCSLLEDTTALEKWILEPPSPSEEKWILPPSLSPEQESETVQ